MNDTKDEIRRQIFFDPPTIEDALKNYTSWFVAQNQAATLEVLSLTRMLSKCINQHTLDTNNRQEMILASVWNPVQQDESRKVTQTFGRVALQAIWKHLNLVSSRRKSEINADPEADDEDLADSFFNLFESALFASLEEDSFARLIWNTDRGKEELTRRAAQRRADAAQREIVRKDETQRLSHIEEID
ncbi:hypothetical protein FisN_26Hu006 [Fistulifera solaris]|jgi:hypothetical protein|uniref:Uncharacterized protein n=1 Tax=Fistulifera solaris TaxID=1519565 RepID=A0A1Z5JXV4_FISSO|nr:hypothetical protein FisN_26Hu006 [Fistulifera solaris]|eukprot:GAX18716.1 hypothetical protein FisN_26Hu006 [Fistulifera solaris]